MLAKDMDCMEQHPYPLFLSVYIRNVHHHHHTHHFHDNCKKDDIYQPGDREYYICRPKVEPFITMTLPNYFTSYSVLSTDNAKIPIFAAENVRIDQNENKVIKRQNLIFLICRLKYPKPIFMKVCIYENYLHVRINNSVG
jgi:hypothetical protein